ncbi:hypothetical protein N7E81_11350 [Reichenbachiella carrageenanivorans]|uniref:Uncharacterized protein n=1 Tax=Reichenbachiella carrageenanivorans TaxID=2979869 RepID=A0ABY6CYU7_9BACT|nr:DUF6624 domain-containing protein [Reichenbachiella carrageenanivorans]UXX77958.1 hypothetical protein N7E81_11350 [Reichenbachiella carrageenanivorans]
MKKHLVACLVLVSTTSWAQDYSSLREKLERFVDQSIEVREAVMPTAERYGFESYPMDSLNQLINFQDSIHLQYVVSVLTEHGWLGRSLIGKKANISLFLAIQNSNDQFREKYYPLLEASAKRGESSLSQMATMKDRILVNKKQPQRYGTQWNYVEDKPVLFPLEDVNSVNENRITVGLAPLTDEELQTVQSKY